MARSHWILSSNNASGLLPREPGTHVQLVTQTKEAEMSKKNDKPTTELLEQLTPVVLGPVADAADAKGLTEGFYTWGIDDGWKKATYYH